MPAKTQTPGEAYLWSLNAMDRIEADTARAQDLVAKANKLARKVRKVLKDAEVAKAATTPTAGA